MERLLPSNVFRIAPVCEYKGAAIIEKAGDVKKAGKQYKTDGSVYLILRQSTTDLSMCFVRYPSEIIVKDVIDCAEPKTFLSMEEVCSFLKIKPLSGPWVWNEEEGRFDRMKHP